MAQDLSAILSELDAAYNPSRQSINQRINSLQGAQSADIAGLQAQQGQAFDDITAGARAKGMGFSGIPISEQAKYTATQFLPAVAKVKQSYNDTRNSLSDALNSLNQDQYKTALGERNNQEQMDFQREQQAAQERAARAAADASSAAMSSLLGGGTSAAPTTPAADPNSALKVAAVNDVKSVLRNNNAGQLTRYYQAVSQSAKNGNQKDALKLQAMQALMPGLFKNGVLNGSYLAQLSRNGIKWYQ